jgi:uncharacterized membrane protein
MVRLIYATLAGLVGASFVHVAIVLLLPILSENDAWRQMQANATAYEPLRLDGNAGLIASRRLDPMFAVAACRYDLGDGVFRITAPPAGAYWSVAVFNDRGRVVFSANDRIAASETLDLAVALPLQLRLAQQNLPESLAGAILTESQRREGFVLVRIFRPDRTWTPATEAFISGIECGAMAL